MRHLDSGVPAAMILQQSTLSPNKLTCPQYVQTITIKTQSRINMAPSKFSSLTSQLCRPALAYGSLLTAPWGKISGWNQPTHVHWRIGSGQVLVKQALFILFS